jgi:UDP-N-acetylmuramoyl-L-alanyl-D-glutamate--2,6-diaminopimelate ligase
VLEVAAPRALLGRFAAHVYGEPARSLRMLGVTGTQGKTTTTRLAESALQRAGSGRPSSARSAPASTARRSRPR